MQKIFPRFTRNLMRRRLLLAILIGFIAAVLFSVSFAIHVRTLHQWVILGALSMPVMPGLISGMMATGNAHTGDEPFWLILVVATLVNTLVYGALSYVGLAIY